MSIHMVERRSGSNLLHVKASAIASAEEAPMASSLGEEVGVSAADAVVGAVRRAETRRPVRRPTTTSAIRFADPYAIRFAVPDAIHFDDPLLIS